MTAYYVLANDIDCTGAGASWSPIGVVGDGFTGTLDGQNHKVTNLDLSGMPNPTDLVGMFNTIKGMAVVKNISIMNGKANGNSNVGMVAGMLGDTATLDNVYAQATVTCHNENCGGLVGSQRGASVISNSGADVTVSNEGQSTGGLVGWIAADGTIQKSFANGHIAGTNYAGGLVGAANTGGDTATLIDVYANATVVASGDSAGGIAGMGISLNLTNAYATGSVSGADHVGGLVGIFFGSMTDTFAANTITSVGSAVGPVTGLFAGGTVGNRYFDTHITGFTASSDGSSPITDSNYFKDSSAHPPFDQWTFSTAMWRTNYAGYPSFAPKVDPYMLCEEPHATATTMTATCDVAPLGWGTPTWQARWSIHGANDWHAIPLSDTHAALATVTGLRPGTEYDLAFQYTNDFGTGPWGTVVILTTGQTPAPQSTDFSPTTTVLSVLQDIPTAIARFYSVAVADDSTAPTDVDIAALDAPQQRSDEPADRVTTSDQTVSSVEPIHDRQTTNNGGVIAFFALGGVALAIWLIVYMRRRHQQ